MLRRRAKLTMNTSSRGLLGIDQLEHKELFASLIGDTHEVPDTTGYTFYSRFSPPIEESSQDGANLLIVNNGAVPIFTKANK